MNLQKLIGQYVPQDIDSRIKESIKLKAPFQHFATVMISDKDRIIKSIGQSKRNNLILDNFGIWLASFMRAPVASQGQITLDNIADTATFINTYEAANHFNSDSDSTGTYMQVGAGSTAAARADFNIETALGTSPEDAVFNSGTGSYTAGAISCAGAITAGGAGTINEVGLFGRWDDYAGAIETFLLFHDILASGEAFVASDTITATYTISL